MFRLMSNQSLVALGSKLGMLAVKLRLPFAETAIKATIFEQFCGGTNLLDCQNVIDRLYRQDTLTILDYGAEGKSDEEDLDHTLSETIKAIEFAASNDSVPVVSSKITGLADNELLIKLQTGDALSPSEQHTYDQLRQRLEQLGSRAKDLGVGVFIDAEESWMQSAIDDLVRDMMHEYNRDKATIFNTYQMYRKDKLDQLKHDFDVAQKEGYLLGAKLVRGAYMDKERSHAAEQGTPCIIHDNKVDVDKDYNEGLRFCVEHYEAIASCNASHNMDSNYLQAKMIEDHQILKNHPHLNFCQLYGMSDHITFNLANKGYNVAKYVPYGPIKEVVPYLIRRAEENTSITGDVGRELRLLQDEMKRRGIL